MSDRFDRTFAVLEMRCTARFIVNSHQATRAAVHRSPTCIDYRRLVIPAVNLLTHQAAAAADDIDGGVIVMTMVATVHAVNAKRDASLYRPTCDMCILHAPKVASLILLILMLSNTPN